MVRTTGQGLLLGSNYPSEEDSIHGQPPTSGGLYGQGLGALLLEPFPEPILGSETSGAGRGRSMLKIAVPVGIGLACLAWMILRRRRGYDELITDIESAEPNPTVVEDTGSSSPESTGDRCSKESDGGRPLKS